MDHAQRRRHPDHGDAGGRCVPDRIRGATRCQQLHHRAARGGPAFVATRADPRARSRRALSQSQPDLFRQRPHCATRNAVHRRGGVHSGPRRRAHRDRVRVRVALRDGRIPRLRVGLVDARPHSGSTDGRDLRRAAEADDVHRRGAEPGGRRFRRCVEQVGSAAANVQLCGDLHASVLRRTLRRLVRAARLRAADDRGARRPALVSRARRAVPKQELPTPARRSSAAGTSPSTWRRRSSPCTC